VTTPDPYRVLGLKPGCPPDKVRAAFRRLSKTAHPDAGGTTEGFAQLSWAHELLTNTRRREWWDEHGWDCGPEKDRQALAVTILQQHLRQLLATDDADPTREDLVRSLTIHFDKEIAASQQNAAKLDRAERRITELRRRFRRKSQEGSSVIHAILDGEAREITNARRQNQQQEAARVELKRMLSEYTLQWDRVVQMVAPNQMYTGNSTSANPVFNWQTR